MKSSTSRQVDLCRDISYASSSPPPDSCCLCFCRSRVCCPACGPPGAIRSPTGLRHETHRVQVRDHARYQVALRAQLGRLRDDPRCQPALGLYRHRNQHVYGEILYVIMSMSEYQELKPLTVVLVLRGAKQAGDSAIHSLVRMVIGCSLWCTSADRRP